MSGAMNPKKVIVIKCPNTHQSNWDREDDKIRRKAIRKRLQKAYGKNNVEVVFLPAEWSLETIPQ